MLAVRRINHPTRIYGLSIRSFQSLFDKSELVSFCDEKATAWHMIQPVMSLKRFYGIHAFSPKSFPGRCMFFSSQVRATGNGHEEVDLEDSQLEDTVVTLDSISEDENMDEFVSEPELSEEDEHFGVEELELDDNEIKGSPHKKNSLILLRLLTNSSTPSVENAMDKWIEDGNELENSDIYFLMVNLRKLRVYGMALQLSEWLESRKKVDFVERDYASRLDLISKARGLHKAESYLRMIPEAFRGEVVYRTLLANCALTTNLKKAEEVFNKMKDLGFPVTAFACNQLLLLHKKRSDNNKIADVLQLMEKENVKPTRFTYHILIDRKGQLKDIGAMEQIFKTMNAEGTEPDKKILALMAKHYVSAGLEKKAKKIMKKIEGNNTHELRKSVGKLLILYSNLGSEEEVARLWKACKRNPTSYECLAAIKAWGKLNKVEEAEAVFNRLRQRLKKKNPPLKLYTMLLKVYVDHKLLVKGKDLVKQMAESGLKTGPLTWDVLVNLHIVLGEVEKADSILMNAVKENRVRLLFQSFMIIMEEYAKRGDVHNTEKLFYRMREAGYVIRIRQFLTLVRAYRIAKVPAYGIRERIKADNVLLSKGLAEQLIEVDAVKRNSVLDLLT